MSSLKACPCRPYRQPVDTSPGRHRVHRESIQLHPKPKTVPMRPRKPTGTLYGQIKRLTGQTGLCQGQRPRRNGKRQMTRSHQSKGRLRPPSSWTKTGVPWGRCNVDPGTRCGFAVSAVDVLIRISCVMPFYASYVFVYRKQHSLPYSFYGDWSHNMIDQTLTVV